VIVDSEKNIRYPIGQFKRPDSISEEHINSWIGILKNFPKQLNHLTNKLNNEQLNTAYRPQGWTIRQVIHHLADSHFNSYIRFK